MYWFFRLLCFLDRHSGLISAVGLVLAGIGLLLTLRYLEIYKGEIKQQGVEQERLAWERILKLLHQVAKWAALANLSSVKHSSLAKAQGFLPPEIAAKYAPATENLLSYWHQLKVELDIMPDSSLIEKIKEFVAKYDLSADSRASEEFADDLQPITHQVIKRAEKSFRNRDSVKAGQKP
ncbi:MAG: hypothetical protein WCA19_21380 [Candidatus Acidiferrales bacterium]